MFAVIALILTIHVHTNLSDQLPKVQWVNAINHYLPHVTSSLYIGRGVIYKCKIALINFKENLKLVLAVNMSLLHNTFFFA